MDLYGLSRSAVIWRNKLVFETKEDNAVSDHVPCALSTLAKDLPDVPF
jgi:hypothetical protein